MSPVLLPRRQIETVRHLLRKKRWNNGTVLCFPCRQRIFSEKKTRGTKNGTPFLLFLAAMRMYDHGLYVPGTRYACVHITGGEMCGLRHTACCVFYSSPQQQYILVLCTYVQVVHFQQTRQVSIKYCSSTYQVRTSWYSCEYRVHTACCKATTTPCRLIMYVRPILYVCSYIRTCAMCSTARSINTNKPVPLLQLGTACSWVLYCSNSPAVGCCTYCSIFIACSCWVYYAE